MRSTNILIILIALNASAALIGASGLGAALGYQPTVGGDDVIDDAEDDAGEIDAERSAIDTFVSGVITAAQTLLSMFSVVIAGPRMLINLGAPTSIVTFVSAPLYILVSIDILEVISGRNIT